MSDGMTDGWRMTRQALKFEALLDKLADWLAKPVPTTYEKEVALMIEVSDSPELWGSRRPGAWSDCHARFDQVTKRMQALLGQNPEAWAGLLSISGNRFRKLKALSPFADKNVLFLKDFPGAYSSCAWDDLAEVFRTAKAGNPGNSTVCLVLDPRRGGYAIYPTGR